MIPREEIGFGLKIISSKASYWLVLVAACFSFALGCSSPGQRRGQAEDDSELHRYDVTTIGESTSVGNAEPIPLGGVGLVEGLEGTGGDCNQDSYRAMLMEHMQKDRVPNPAALLKSPECALVIIEAFIPPGASKDDKIDVEVKLPPGSKATSLRGGVLRKCYLYNYDFARNLRPDYQGGQNMLLGHKVAIAKGPVLVGMGDGEDAGKVKSGRIWAGARLLKDNPLVLVMNPDKQQARYTSLIADRINATFQGGGIPGVLDTRVAGTSDNMSIALRVPAQYRHNLTRFLRVVRAIPMSDSADAPGKTEADRRSYRQKLGEDLMDPARTLVAALRLEALGPKSVPILKEKGLKSPELFVRFCSAESLAYLGSPSCGEELAKVAISYPILRAHALTALGSLDEAICHLKLKELVVSNLDDDLRYGAFRSLKLLNDSDPLVRGEQPSESFWLHSVGGETKPFIHISTNKFAEVVLFGESQKFKPPFSFLAGEFAVTASKEDNRCTVSRFPLGGDPSRKQCGLEAEEIIRTMADLGAQFSDVITLMQQAASCESLTCRVRVDAIPQPANLEELIKLGKDSGDWLEGKNTSGSNSTEAESKSEALSRKP